MYKPITRVVAGSLAAALTGAPAYSADPVPSPETGFYESARAVRLEKQLQQSLFTTSDGKPVGTGSGGVVLTGPSSESITVSTFSPLEDQVNQLKEFFTPETRAKLGWDIGPYIPGGVDGVVEGLKKYGANGVTYESKTIAAPAVGAGVILGLAWAGGAFKGGSSGAAAAPTCFTADTKVLMADGRLKPIVKIKEGEKVQSFNFMTNRKVRSKVTRLFQFPSQSHLVLNGALKVTEKHPFAVGMDSWREAGELRKGDVVLGKKDIMLKSIRKILRATPVFNLTVAGTHNYYVSDGKDTFLVHNKGAVKCFIKGSHVKMANGSIKKIERIKIGEKVKGFDLLTRKWKNYPVTELQSGKKRLGYYLINKKLKVSPVHKIYTTQGGKTATQLTLGDAISNGRKKIRITSIELIKKKADRYNVVLGKNVNILYIVDGFLVHNGW